MGLGDAVHSGLRPLVKLVDETFGTDLLNCEKCNGPRKDFLNQVGERLAHPFRRRKPQEEESDKIQMIRTYNIQVQKADNGFIAIGQNDDGQKVKKIIATDEKTIIAAVKTMADHMFDAPPPKAVATNETAKSVTRQAALVQKG